MIRIEILRRTKHPMQTYMIVEPLKVIEWIEELF
jgi:hypothetical protein